MKSKEKRKRRGAIKKWLKDHLGNLGLQQNPSQSPQTKMTA
jgi:hypothetical protein